MDLSGLQVDLLTLYYCENENYKKFIEDNGGNVFCLGLPFCPGKSRRKMIPKLKRFFKTNRYDIVHIHSGSISVLAYGAKYAHKAGIRKIIVHSHSGGIESIKHKLLKKMAALHFEKYATYCFACSKEAAEFKYDACVKRKVRLFKNGVDIEKFSFNYEKRCEIRKIYNIKDDQFVVGHVGRFTYEKNHEFIVKLIEDIARKKEYSNMKFMFIGDGPLFCEIQKSIVNKGLLDYVLFIGAVDNVHDFMNAMDVLVLPSLYEGMPMVSVEAQANGLPVVLSTTITKEVKLTTNCKYVDLDDDLNNWEKVIVSEEKGRADNSNIIKKSGFDIHATAEELRKIYIGIDDVTMED